MFATAKEEIKALHQLLLAVHKSLLNFQKEVQQELEGRELNAHDLWHLSLNHHEFEWIKSLFSILLQVDDKLDDKEADFVAYKKEAQSELSKLLIDPVHHGQFKGKLEVAKTKHPVLLQQVEELKNFING